MVLQIEQVDHLLHLLARLDLGLAHLAAEEQLLQQVGAAVDVAADQQVLQHGGVLEQLDVLKGAAQCPARRSCAGAGR